jgi:hypothetical protein
MTVVTVGVTSPLTAGVAFEQEVVLLHQPIDALGVDRGHTVGSPLARLRSVAIRR